MITLDKYRAMTDREKFLLFWIPRHGEHGFTFVPTGRKGEEGTELRVSCTTTSHRYQDFLLMAETFGVVPQQYGSTKRYWFRFAPRHSGGKADASYRGPRKGFRKVA